MGVDVVKLMKLFEATLDVLQKNKLKLILESFVFFFRFQKDVFGANEASRVTFAKMKDPKDEDNNPAWLKEANFVAVNLNKLGQGQQVQMIFSNKELGEIGVVSKKDALSTLEEFFEREKDNTDQQQNQPTQ